MSKTSTPKRIAAAVLLDAIDMLRDRDLSDFNEITDSNYAEVRAQIEKIMTPFVDRLDNITGPSSYDFLFGKK